MKTLSITNKGAQEPHIPVLTGTVCFTHVFLGSFLIMSLKMLHEDDNYSVILFIKEVTFELVSKKANGSLPAGEREEGGCSRQEDHETSRQGNGIQLRKEEPGRWSRRPAGRSQPTMSSCKYPLYHN